MVETRIVPKQSLARMFPGGFAEFWAKLDFKKDLEQIIYAYIPATIDRDEMKKTLASGGFGWTAIPIVKHFFDRYQYRTFEPYEDDFIAQFKSLCILAVSEIRKKEHLWQNIYREVERLLKPLKLKTDTRTSQNYDKTQQIGGKTVNTGNESQNWSEQKQSNQKNILSFSNVDLSSAEFGGFSRQNQLSTQSQEQNQGSRNREHKNTTDRINHINHEHYRSKKDENVSITTQESYELAQAAARIINNFALTVIDFTQYYKLFDKLWVKLFGCSVVPVIDPITGRRKYITEAQYEEIVAEETQGTRPPEGNEWDETLPYLQRLKIYHTKIQKEYKKLPETSNRKPRIGRRLEIAEGCIKAYEKLQAGIELPSVDEFLARVNGQREGYQKVIGYENIIETITDYLQGWEFYKQYGGEMPDNLMLFLLGEPGLGKSYISQAIAQALGRQFHVVFMNGEKEANVVKGTNIDNPGAEAGEIVKAIFRREDAACVMLFDELEKAGKDAKRALGNPTDRTFAKVFKDNFFDFPTPCDNLFFIGTGNYPEDLPDFAEDRFRVILVKPLDYWQRIEVLRNILAGKLKGYDNAFRIIYNKGWQEIYALFDQEELYQKILTWTMSIRGAKDNLLSSLVPTLKAKFLIPKRALPEDVVNFDWGFVEKEQIDKGDRDRGRPACPYSVDRNNDHREGCVCFVANLEKVEGWEEEMGGYDG